MDLSPTCVCWNPPSTSELKTETRAIPYSVRKVFSIPSLCFLTCSEAKCGNWYRQVSENKEQGWATTHTGPPSTALNLEKAALLEWLLIAIFIFLFPSFFLRKPPDKAKKTITCLLQLNGMAVAWLCWVQPAVQQDGWNSPLWGRRVLVLLRFIQPPPSEGLVGSAAPIGTAEVKGGICFL